MHKKATVCAKLLLLAENHPTTNRKSYRSLVSSRPQFDPILPVTSEILIYPLVLHAMGQLISPTTPDYRLYYAREVPVPPNHPRPIHISIGTFHLPPIQVVLTRYQSEYILMLRFEFNMDFEDISWRVNQLWRRKGIRMSPQHVSDILAQAKEEARDFEDHPYHFYSNRYLATLVQHRWRMSQCDDMAPAREAEDTTFLERPRLRKRGCTVP